MSVDRHWTDKKVEMTESDWRMFQEDFNAQMAEIPAGLQQRDVIGIGETGSGKTTAFVLRILTRLRPMSEESKAQGPYAIVLAPTHERVKLIEIETAKAAHYMGINVVSILYEQSIEEQGSRLRQGCEVVIATPGRLFDCLKRGSLVLNQCHYVVVDGFDRMVDMGFASHVVGVLHSMPSGNLKPENENEELDDKKVYRTTYMFSATMSPALEWLARQYLRNPVTIGTVGKTTDLIPQNVIMCEESEKLERLKRLLDEIGDKTAIVFVNNRDKADFVARSLDDFVYCVTTLHGRKTQAQREISLEGLQRKRYNVLVATDIGAHQIDVPDVAHVINFDTATFEIHTHRIRHIGLTGKTGMATTFLTMHDSGVYFELKHMLIQSNSHVPHELEEHEASKVPVRFIRTLVAH